MVCWTGGVEILDATAGDHLMHADGYSMARDKIELDGIIQYVARAEMPGEEAFQAACELGLEGIVSMPLTAPYKSDQCKSWIKVRNPESVAYRRIIDTAS
jgi:ATP-dependent DNA ligase